MTSLWDDPQGTYTYFPEIFLQIKVNATISHDESLSAILLSVLENQVEAHVVVMVVVQVMGWE